MLNSHMHYENHSMLANKHETHCWSNTEHLYTSVLASNTLSSLQKTTTLTSSAGCNCTSPYVSLDCVKNYWLIRTRAACVSLTRAKSGPTKHWAFVWSVVWIQWFKRSGMCPEFFWLRRTGEALFDSADWTESLALPSLALSVRCLSCSIDWWLCCDCVFCRWLWAVAEDASRNSPSPSLPPAKMNGKTASECVWVGGWGGWGNVYLCVFLFYYSVESAGSWNHSLSRCEGLPYSFVPCLLFLFVIFLI